MYNRGPLTAGSQQDFHYCVPKCFQNAYTLIIHHTKVQFLNQFYRKIFFQVLNHPHISKFWSMTVKEGQRKVMSARNRDKEERGVHLLINSKKVEIWLCNSGIILYLASLFDLLNCLVPSMLWCFNKLRLKFRLMNYGSLKCHLKKKWVVIVINRAGLTETMFSPPKLNQKFIP